jgi:hypothetical protein
MNAGLNCGALATESASPINLRDQSPTPVNLAPVSAIVYISEGRRVGGQALRATVDSTARAYGITSANVPDLVEKAAKASSMKANPIVLTAAE